MSLTIRFALSLLIVLVTVSVCISIDTANDEPNDIGDDVKLSDLLNGNQSLLNKRKSKSGKCDRNTLVIYQMILTTRWSEQLFPNQYPTWRPPAQWSPTFGNLF